MRRNVFLLTAGGVAAGAVAIWWVRSTAGKNANFYSTLIGLALAVV